MKVQNLRFCGTPLYRYIEFAGIHTDPSFASEGTASPKLAVRSDDRTSQTCGLSGCRSCSPHSLLRRNGLISSEVVFIDGTKIEANANKYTFVWKKAVSKNQARMLSKVAELIEVCEEVYGIRVAYNDRISLGTIKQLVLQLEKLCRKERVVFVSGTGKRKTPLQRYVEQAREYLQRMEDYVYKLDVCGDRNSYSKTDHDATFMRMKEDAMLNGQLKPAYNVQHAVDAGFITWVDVSSRPGDTLTLRPMLKEMEEHLHFKYRDIVADAGYESEENYLFLEKNGQSSYIKPTNYEISRTRKYKTDIGRRENMSYDKETGQRAGELAALQKSDDLGEYLHVHRQQIKGKDKDGHQVFYDVGYTKDERFHPHDGRLIPITPECRKVLDMANALPGNSEYIFHNKKGKPIQRDSYIQNLGRRCRRLNIDCTHNHAFRVAFNSRLIKLGFSSADRALILGHEVQTNEAHYSVTDKRLLADLHKKLTGETPTGNKNTDNFVIKEEQ